MSGTGSSSVTGGASTNAYGSTTGNTSGSMSAMSYFMNGYQGPLNTSSFSGYTTAQSFIPAAALNGMREVELSQVAQQKAKSPEVKAFAAMMVGDHSQSNRQLMGIASSKNVTVSSSLQSSTGSTMSTSGSATTGSMNHSSGTMGTTGTQTSGSVTTPGTTGSASVGAGVTGSAGTTGSTGSMGAGSTGTMGATGSGTVSGATDLGTTGSTSMGATSTTTSGSYAGTTGASTGYNSGSVSSATGSANDLISLQNLTGTAFDLQYMRMMLQDHLQAIALFTSATQSTDPEVRAYARKTLPVLQAHFNHARSVHNRAFQQ
jgi:predicted outer membrane protein